MDGEGLITRLIKVAEDVSRGDFGSYDEIFELTKTGKYPEPIARLAEAFGMMIVKVEARELKLEQTIGFLQKAQIELAEAHNALKKRHYQLKKTLKNSFPFSNIIGLDKGFKDLIKRAELLSRTDINVLITGETGTGKEVFAKSIHFNSDRREGPFVAINCSAIPESLFESEVFGIEKGTATGVNQKIGKMEQANGGTLFLDEIGDMPLSCQAKMLRAIEERKIERVGGREEIALDIRVICATHKDLKVECERGNFRQDLFYRLNVGSLKIPPLRERQGDIALLANHFIDIYSRKYGKKGITLSAEVINVFEQYPWYGNVRELENEVERAVALSITNHIEIDDLSEDIKGYFCKTSPKGKGTMEDEKEMLSGLLDRFGGNKTKVARHLGLSREGLRKKIKRLGVQ